MSDNFVLYSSESVDDTGITANGTYDLLTSPEQSNSQGYKSIRVNVEYENVDPGEYGQFAITAFIEGKYDSTWIPVGYQFEPYRFDDQGKKHTIVVQPDMSNPDEGVCSDIWDGGKVVVRQSKQSGVLPLVWRVRVQIVENGYGGANPFVLR